jgi:hypothetical protein
MATIWTLPACFAHFGVVASHRHFSLSAVSSDGKTIVVAMWADEFERHGDQIMYQSRYRPIFKGKLRRISNQWIANLKWACRHCDCLVRVVIIQADDVEANTRTIKFCRPDNSLIMRITHLTSKQECFERRVLDQRRRGRRLVGDTHGCSLAAAECHLYCGQIEVARLTAAGFRPLSATRLRACAR